MANDRVVVVNGARTPFVRARGVYKKMSASNLGGIVLREAIARSDLDPKLVEEVYLGIVAAPAEGPNVAREAVFDSGLPATIPATTINRYCASSMEATAAIAGKILAGQIQVGIAAGSESISSMRALFSAEATDFFYNMSRAKGPGQMMGMMAKFQGGYFKPQVPGINEPTTGLSMGQSADLMAREFHISREEQDKYAVESHLKAYAAWERGFYKSHVVPVATPEGKVIDRDTDVRSDSNVEKLATLKPVFYRDSAATITAANASPLTDGASSVLLMTESRARELKMQVLGVIRGYASAAIDLQKEPLLIGPVFAIPRALKSAGISWNDLDLLEIHEAFAAQVLSNIKAIESKEWAKEKLGMDHAIGTVDRSKLNVNGGSIPLGHPFGATGGRMILQTLHELRNRKKNLGLISICAAGGLGSVMILEAI